MLALKIVGILLLAIVLLLLVRVGCQAEWSADGLVLRLKVACFHIQILPGKEKADGEQNKKKKRKKNKKKKKAEPEEPEKEKKKLGDLKWLLGLVGPVLKALGRLRRKLYVKLLRVDYCIGGANDPADAAIRYGVICAGGGALLPLLDGAFRVGKWDLNVDVDLQSDSTRVAVSAEGSYRIGQLLFILLSLAVSALKAYLDRDQTAKKTDSDKHADSDDKEEHEHGRKASDR